MQVSHQEDHVTHAVIGGDATIDFGISNSAEFFNILSSTLYKDQILAVVREGLCNAWDAHIEAGLQHVPVEITLTEDKFVIKDKGNGIPRDKIGEIYGTYGASTKTNDGKQTGGFGLGCKSPFAYTDHFEVVSCNSGVKTIYNMSKSSAQVGGKPGIIPLASFPTEDTGLQVSINIKSYPDFQRFRQLVKRIASNGDMNMTLNGDVLGKLEFNTSKANYLILQDNLLCDDSWVMVRYGNVIYPVESCDELEDTYGEIVQFLSKLTFYGTSYRIVFQAPPHSIAVTPSRETLSMQEHTIATLKTLFTGFLDTIKGEFETACGDLVEVLLKNGIMKAKPQELMSRTERLEASKLMVKPTRIEDLPMMAKRFMTNHYPGSLEFKKRDITMRINAMVERKLVDRGLAQTFLRGVQELTTLHGLGEGAEWFSRRIAGPLLAKLQMAKIDHHRLYVWDRNDLAVDNFSQYRVGFKPIAWAGTARPRHLLDCIPYLRNIVVVAASTVDLQQRAYRMPEFQALGQHEGFLFYHTGTKKADKEAAVAFFKAQGMKVVDLTFKQEWEIGDKPAEKAPRKPKKVGLPVLSSILMPSQEIKVATFLREDAPRITAPEFLIALSSSIKEPQDCLEFFPPDVSRAIVKLWGNKGGITNNSAIHAKWKHDKQLPDFLDYVIAKVTQEMLTNPRIQEYWPYHLNQAEDKVSLGNKDRTIAKMIFQTPELRQHFKLVNNLTEEDKLIVQVWEELQYRHRYSNVEVRKVEKHLEQFPVHMDAVKVVSKVKGCSMTSILDDTHIRLQFREHQPGSQGYKSLIKVIEAILSL